MKRMAKKAEKAAKKAMFSMLSLAVRRRGEVSVQALHDVKRILVIRPNYRIGNAILSTAIIAPLQARFPGATVDFLATDKTRKLFDNLPVGRVMALSRSAITRPWQAVGIMRQLRAQRYDLAVQLEQSSMSGLLISRVAGARHVMGQARGDAAWYDINVREPIQHSYDTAEVFARALDVAGRTMPRLAVSATEAERAAAHLQTLKLSAVATDKVEPFVAIFVGGHADKICPPSFWIELSQGLEAIGRKFVVFVGPEEAGLLPQLQQELAAMTHGALCPPRPLREFTAMLAQASLIVTPDSGPMHMAAALDVPIVLVARTRKSLAFMPPGEQTRVVWDLNVEEVLACVRSS